MNRYDAELLARQFRALQQRGEVLARKCEEHKAFAQFVVALLTERGANTISELPVADQMALAERGAGLSLGTDLEAEQAELERLHGELWAQLPPDFSPVH